MRYKKRVFTLPLNDDDYIEAAKLLRLGNDIAAIKAVAAVESGSQGGFCPDDFPVIRLEGHVFHRFTKGIYDSAYPTISFPAWTTKFNGKTWKAERDRFNTAVSLDRSAAIMATSWGRFQIMGFNHGVCGCSTPQKFVNLMCRSEHDQLDLFCEYIMHNCLDDELREHRWDDFAYKYNGPLYQKNDYAGQLDRWYLKFS
jgi:hypothetical protein